MNGAPAVASAPSRQGLFVYLAMAGQTLISAGTFLVAKATLAELGPFELAWMRFAAAALAFAGLLRLAGRSLLPPRQAWRGLLVLGILAVPVNQVGFLWGLSHSLPSHAAILYALTPALVLLGARAFLGEVITIRQAAGLLCALAGAAVVLLQGGLRRETGTLFGDLLIFAAVAAWSAYTVLARPRARRHGALATTGWALMIGTLLFLPAGPWVLRPPAAVASVSSGAWLGLAYLALVTSVAAYYLYSYGLKRMEAARVAVFTNLQPVATALLSWWLLDEVLTGPTVAGGLLVIAGVTLTQRG